MKEKKNLCQWFKLNIIFLNTNRSEFYMAYIWGEWIDLSTSGLDYREHAP